MEKQVSLRARTKLKILIQNINDKQAKRLRNKLEKEISLAKHEY